jgi:hypothetical protein
VRVSALTSRCHPVILLLLGVGLRSMPASTQATEFGSFLLSGSQSMVPGLVFCLLFRFVENLSGPGDPALQLEPDPPLDAQSPPRKAGTAVYW